MKYYETSCAEYISASKRANMHPELEPICAKMPASLSSLGNIIFYGPSGVGKYTQFLRFIERYATTLKTDKMVVNTDKQKYEYHISDVHYEIDLAMLGCESKKIWNECFFQIVDIVSAKQSKCGIILCKNFQSIHSELLDVFYSYMQQCRALSIHLVFVILTEHVSFIPNRILQCCKLIHVKRPAVELYRSSSSSMITTAFDLRDSLRCAKEISQENPRTPTTSCPAFFASSQPKSHKTFLHKIHPNATSFALSDTPESHIPKISDLQPHFPVNSILDLRDSLHCAKEISPVNPRTPTTSCPALFAVSNLSGESLKSCSHSSLRNCPKSTIVPEHLLNLKEMHSIAALDAPPKDVFNIVCDNIIAKIVQHETLDIISLRDNLYDILLYGLDVTECLWYILYYFVENEILVDKSGEVMSEIMKKTDAFLRFYNNNYRPIYHLESIFIYLITKIYKYESKKST